MERRTFAKYSVLSILTKPCLFPNTLPRRDQRSLRIRKLPTRLGGGMVPRMRAEQLATLVRGFVLLGIGSILLAGIVPAEVKAQSRSQPIQTPEWLRDLGEALFGVPRGSEPASETRAAVPPQRSPAVGRQSQGGSASPGRNTPTAQPPNHHTHRHPQPHRPGTNARSAGRSPSLNPLGQLFPSHSSTLPPHERSKAPTASPGAAKRNWLDDLLSPGPSQAFAQPESTHPFSAQASNSNFHSAPTLRPTPVGQSSEFPAELPAQQAPLKNLPPSSEDMAEVKGAPPQESAETSPSTSGNQLFEPPLEPVPPATGSGLATHNIINKVTDDSSKILSLGERVSRPQGPDPAIEATRHPPGHRGISPQGSFPPLPRGDEAGGTGVHRRIEQLVNSPFEALGGAPMDDEEAGQPHETAPATSRKPPEPAPALGLSGTAGRAIAAELTPTPASTSKSSPAEPSAESAPSKNSPRTAPGMEAPMGTHSLQGWTTSPTNQAAGSATWQSSSSNLTSEQPAPSQIPRVSSSTAQSDQQLQSDQQVQNLGQKPRILVTHQGPSIHVEAFGPEQLLTGQAADYTLRVQNSGDLPAENFTLQVSLPGWVELVGSKPSAGRVETAQQLPGASSELSRQVFWQLPSLQPGQSQTLELRLLPRRSQSLDLAVLWSHEPAQSRAVIQVHEPRLELRLATGRELLGRMRQPLEVRLLNRGTAPAENVQLRFAVDGAAEISPLAVHLEQVAVGEEKSILVDIAPLRAGSLTLTCQAAAQGGFQTQFSERLLVREPRVVARWHLPETMLVDTEVEIQLVLANEGDAPAENTEVILRLPPAVEIAHRPTEVESGSERGQLIWKPGTVASKEEKTLSLRLRPREVGQFVWTAYVQTGPWHAEATAQGNVQGFANLQLALRDPGRPSPVATEVPYEIRLENRGTKPVDSCEVVVFFSWGIEPVAAEGAPALIAPGQVIFGRVGPLAPGEVRTLRVLARAETSGNHACRAEVIAPDFPARLVAQQLTLFYQQSGPRIEADRFFATKVPALPQTAKGGNSPELLPGEKTISHSAPGEPTVSPEVDSEFARPEDRLPRMAAEDQTKGHQSPRSWQR